LRPSRSNHSKCDAPACFSRRPQEAFLATESSTLPQSWWKVTRGDIDATIAQFGCIIAQMFIPVLLVLPLGVSLRFGIDHFVPGFASGLFIGSAGLAWLGVRLGGRENRRDVTAHPYGNNVPAILAFTLSIFLPVYLQTHNTELAWAIGAAAVVWTGIFKLTMAPFAGAIRRFIPLTASMTVFGAAMYSYLAMVLLQRVFDQPLVGIVALAIICVAVFANVPITSYKLPPFLIAWIVPLILGIAVGYVHPSWTGAALELPWVRSAAPLRAMILAIPYFSVIVPISMYHVLQDIASVEGAASAGDNYDARSVVACDAVGTLFCGFCGSIVSPVVYALHPPYRALGARIGYAFWTPLLFLTVVVSGLLSFISGLFPWPILAAMIAYVSVGVGTATLRCVDRKYWSAVLLGFMIPVGAVVSAALNSTLPALHISPADAGVQAALDRAIYWSSVQGLGNGFLFLVLVIAAVISEMIDRKFGRAAIWCLVASAFSWVGLMHSATLRWRAEPMYAAGWLGAAAVVYSARWWGARPTPANAESNRPALAKRV
jgi:AGZA family xanthine/uracil permease-like MFS transporter